MFFLFLILLHVCKSSIIFYDVTSTEGFNLRRDVYIRIVNFVRLLDASCNWTIVLPPMRNLYHWRSTKPLFWRDLFDMKSLNTVQAVIDLDKFYKMTSSVSIDLAIVLMYHPNAEYDDFSSKVDIINCTKKDEKHKIFNLLPVKKTICLNIRMDIAEFSEYFKDLIKKYPGINTFYIHDAEKLIHGKYSEWSERYWTVRRSMVFSSNLRSIGDEFRKTYLFSNDFDDNTPFLNDWRLQHKSFAKGGPFIGAHLRRQDFIWDRDENYPNVEEIVNDISKLCKLYNLNTVFIATDTSNDEKNHISSLAKGQNLSIIYFTSNHLHPGEIAIVDQWIATHARAFIGTFQSTFTFRIFEERQIMNFHSQSTHNLFCPDRLKNQNKDDDCCSKPTIWPVIYELEYLKQNSNSKNEL